MNNLSITSPKAPLIKSWFGFVLGAASVAISLFGLSKSFDLAGILSTEPYRVCRRVNILRDYPDDKIKIYP